MTDFLTVIKEHLRIKNRIIEITKEIGSLPDIPKDIDTWMNSLPDLNPNNRNISLPQLSKRNKLRREYLRLKEEESENVRHMKILRIAELIKNIEHIESKNV